MYGWSVGSHRLVSFVRPRVVALMVGDKLAQESAQATHQKRLPRGTGEIRLSAKGLSKRGTFRDISFDLYAGEIFCITGLIGSKRTELVRTLFGSDQFDGGTMEIEADAFLFPLRNALGSAPAAPFLVAAL